MYTDYLTSLKNIFYYNYSKHPVEMKHACIEFS